MCPDAYFVHCCPEWEDLDLDDYKGININNPDWSKINLKGYKDRTGFIKALGKNAYITLCLKINLKNYLNMDFIFSTKSLF